MTTSPEEHLRRVQAGASFGRLPRSVPFLGRDFPVRDGELLAPLLAYIQAGRESLSLPEGSQQRANRQMAAAYELLATCVEPRQWPRFEQLALEGKAREEDIAAAIKALVSMLTGRADYVGSKLLTWVVANLGEVEGHLLLAAGRGLAGLTPRQACNLAYASITQGMDEEQREQFAEDLLAPEDPEQAALEKALAMIEARKKAEANGV